MFDSLKKMVFQEDSPKAVQSVPASTQQASSPIQPVSSAYIGGFVTQPVVQSTDSVLDVKAIEESINGLILANPDFAQFAAFAQTAENLKSVILDEATRYKAAQATTSISRDALIASVKSSETIIANEASNFEQSFVTSANNEIAQLNAQSDAIATQLQTLTQQLGQLSDQKTELTKAITSKTADLGKAGIDFNSVVKTLGTRYQEIGNKLQQYLGA